jgi:hypothetical protein
LAWVDIAIFLKLEGCAQKNDMGYKRTMLRIHICIILVPQGCLDLVHDIMSRLPLRHQHGNELDMV